MSSLSIHIADEATERVFDTALNEASIVAGDMIEVRTAIRDGAVTKIVRTECPVAFAIIRSMDAGVDGHD